MNTLSWLIYAADALQNVAVILTLVASLTAVGLCIAALMIGLMDADSYKETRPVGRWKRPLWWVAAPVAVLIFAALMPSSRTMYLIAASEAGETIVTSPDAIEMMGDLKAIIKKRLKDELTE